MRARTFRFGVFRRSDSAQENEDEDNNCHRAKKAGGSIAPRLTVRPSWYRAEQHKDQKHEKNGSDWHGLFLC